MDYFCVSDRFSLYFDRSDFQVIRHFATVIFPVADEVIHVVTAVDDHVPQEVRVLANRVIEAPGAEDPVWMIIAEVEPLAQFTLQVKERLVRQTQISLLLRDLIVALALSYELLHSIGNYNFTMHGEAGTHFSM